MIRVDKPAISARQYRGSIFFKRPLPKGHNLPKARGTASAMRRAHGRRQWIVPDDDDERVEGVKRQEVAVVVD